MVHQPDFDGETYDPERDHERLTRQFNAVRLIMSDHNWHTLSEISEATGYPMQSISARLRDFRKAKYGEYEVERRYVHRGLWEYRMGEMRAAQT